MRLLLTLTVCAAALAVTGCGDDDTSSATTTTRYVDTATVDNIDNVLCVMGDPADTPPGVPVAVTIDELDAAQCVPGADGVTWPTDATLWWVPVGADRDAAEVTALSRDGDIAVTITHTRPGDTCAVTTEFRGALGVIVATDERAPSTDIVDNPQEC